MEVAGEIQCASSIEPKGEGKKRESRARWMNPTTPVSQAAVSGYCSGSQVAPSAPPQRRTSSTEHQCRLAKGLHEPDALGMTLDRQVEATEAVPCERVRAALQHQGVRLEHLGVGWEQGGGGTSKR